MFLLTIILALNMSEQNCGFFVNDNSYQFYKNCSGFSHSKGTVMQCTFLESKNIGIFRDINFLMPDYELPEIKRVKLLKFFVAKTLWSNFDNRIIKVSSTIDISVWRFISQREKII